MSPKQASSRSIVYRFSRQSLALLLFCMGGSIFASGCGDPTAGAAVGVLAAPLWPFLSIAGYAEMQKAINDANERLPVTDVEILNDTDQQAAVYLTPGIIAPVPDALAPFAALFGGFPTFTPLSYSSEPVVVKPHGRATGRIKCADILGVSVLSPPDAVLAYGYVSTEYEGLYQDPGNITLTGVGISSKIAAEFSGDIVEPQNGVRFVRPEVDGLVCGTSTLVVHIITPGTSAVINPQTGVLQTPGTFGSGILSLR